MNLLQKNRVVVIIAVLLMMMVTGCSKDKPQVRVINQRPQIADVQLKRSQGNTLNINDVGGQSTTGYIEVSPSNYEVDVKIEGISSQTTTFFNAEEDAKYTIVIFNTNPPTVQVTSP